MSKVLTKIPQSACFKKKDRIPYINAVVLMGLFTFLFLGAEYLYVDVLSRMVSEDKTVLAQNYALGVSAAGFLLYPLLNRFCKNRLKTVCFAVFGLASVSCIAFVCMATAYSATFTGVKVDGTLIDAKNYTAVSGSTVITLKADYLKTLSIGTHKLTVVYTEGECSTNFEVKKVAKSPQTGDNSMILLWVTLLFVSGAGVIGTTVYGRKKKV